MIPIFFYGLFMDQALLTDMGLQPETVGAAMLPGYRIHIGERATLLPAAGHRAYGMVVNLTDDEAQRLYSEPSVREYIRICVSVRMVDTDATLDVHCYILPPELGAVGANPEYAEQLAQLTKALNFEQAYVDEIAAYGKVS